MTLPIGSRLIARAVSRAPRPGAVLDTVTLDYEGRFLRRRTLTTDAGRALLVDLAETRSLDEGDAFETLDGRLVAVRAAPEPLIEITAGADQLARLAWHVGNRHAPAQIEPGRLLIRADRVLADMLARLGAATRPVFEPFRPEGGAYGRGRTHGHHHGGAQDDPHALGAHGDGRAPSGRGGDGHGDEGNSPPDRDREAAHDHGHDHGDGHDHRHGHAHGHAPGADSRPASNARGGSA